MGYVQLFWANYNDLTVLPPWDHGFYRVIIPKWPHYPGQ